MASIAKRPHGRWRARYRDEADKEHSRHFDRKVDAQRWLDVVTASVVRGDYVDPRAGRVTLGQYARRWEDVQVSNPGTRRIVDNALRLHLLPALGFTPIASIRTSAVQGFVKELKAKGLAAGSVRNVYDVTAQVFAAAVDDRVIATSPCRRIRLPNGDSGEVVPPPVEEVAALAVAIGERWRAVVVVLAGSGLRIGELRGLMVDDVDFLRRTIGVERQREQAGRLVPVKSKTSRSTVPVGQVVIDELAAHLATLPDYGRPVHRRVPQADVVLALEEVDGNRRHRLHRHDGPQPPALLRLGVDRPRGLGQTGADGAWSRVRGHHAADLRPSVARRRGPDPERDGRRPQSSCGLLAD